MQLLSLIRRHYRPLIYILVIILINLFLFRIAFVYGESMEPTLHNGQPLLVKCFAYEPVRGEIVVTTTKNSFNRNLIKRVIAVEGDVIQITADSVLLNGELLSEPYLATAPVYSPLEMTVPEGYVFLMGDNRNFSRDSRDIGCIPVSEIIGKVILPSF